jgi:hypothetical protein
MPDRIALIIAGRTEVLDEARSGRSPPARTGHVDDGRRSALRALERDFSRAPMDADVTAERIRTHDA